MRIRGDTLWDLTNIATAQNYDLTLDFLPRLAIQVRLTDATPAAKTFTDTDVDVVLDKITISSHGFVTGLKGQFTTTGTLPGGLSAATDYWIIKLDNDTVQVADSLANAEAGTYVLINSTGSGTQTFTPTAFGGATLKLQSSNDQTNFVDVPPCVVSVSVAGTTLFNVVEPSYRFLRLRYEPGAGMVNLNAILNGYSSFALTE